MDKDFANQYKHPNWQRKRLEALEAAEYRCMNCGDSESQLHVHHKRYVKGRKVWEYELSELSVLCDECHDDVHKRMADITEIFSRIDPQGVIDISSLVAGFVMTTSGPASADVADILSRNTTSHYWAVVGGIAGAISGRNIPVEKLISVIRQIDESDIHLRSGTLSITINGGDQ